MSRPIDVIPRLNATRALISPNVCSLLVDGWLSPRMMYMLECTAESVSTCLGDIDIFTKFRPTPLAKCCCLWSGIHRIDYIPTEVLQRNSQGLYKSFADGWEIAWRAILQLIMRKEAPTTSRVQNEICRMNCDLRKWSHFVEKGGKIEYAIDALLDITKNVVINGDDGWEYCDYKEKIEALPATPFDKSFDLAKVKCLEITNENFRNQPQGPYRHNFDSDDDHSY